MRFSTLKPSQKKLKSGKSVEGSMVQGRYRVKLLNLFIIARDLGLLVVNLSRYESKTQITLEFRSNGTPLITLIDWGTVVGLVISLQRGCLYYFSFTADCIRTASYITIGIVRQLPLDSCHCLLYTRLMKQC